MLSSAGASLKDPGFWLAVVIVNVVVSTALVLVGAPGFRR
jgi:hypothetical protein